MNFKKLIFITIGFLLITSFSCQKNKPASFAIEEDTLKVKTAASIEKTQTQPQTLVKEKAEKPEPEKETNIALKCNILERYDIPLPTNLLDTSYLGNPDFSQLFPPDSASRLIKSYDKAFYFGVYTSDLVYTIIYDNPSLFYQYYATVMRLSNELGIKQTFTSEMLEKFRENYRSDTVERLIKESLTKTCIFLDENNQIGILPFMIVGSWAESMYLTIGNAIENQDVPMDIYRTIASQSQIIDKLKELLDDNLLAVEDYNLSIALHELIKNLDVIKQTYEQVYISDNISIDKESLMRLYNAFAQLKGKYL